MVPPGITASVSVGWPVLSSNEFAEFSGLELLWELRGNDMREKDGSCAQLVGGIAPLRVGQQAKACQPVLFHNPSEKTITLLPGDVIGHAKLAKTGSLNPVWLQAIEDQKGVHAVAQPARGQGAVPAERTQQLIQQLGIMDNRLLANHPEVRQSLINLVTRYECVFTADELQ